MSNLASTVDIPQLIDDQKIGSVQLRVLMLCAAILFADGFDAQAIGYVAPALSKAWALKPGALGPVFGTGLFGLMLGALIFGPLADKVGRKPVVLLCTLAFGLCSLATPLATSLDSLLAIRFLTGLGLGGCMPNAIALTCEYGPRRKRTTMVMVMFCGFSLGSAAGGALAAKLIPSFGWQSVFVLGGLLPIALVPLVAFALPESLHVLAHQEGKGAVIRAILARINPALTFADDVLFRAHSEKPGGFPVKKLFHESRALPTLLLWTMFFMNLLDLYFMANWLPTVANNVGHSMEAAVNVGAVFQVGGTIGTVALGLLIDRFGPYRVLTPTFLAGGCLIASIGTIASSLSLLIAFVFAAGFCVVGAQIGLNAVAANYYPAYIRSTGVGWALGVGRIGSIVGPVLGGIMISLQWTMPAMFVAGALAQGLAATAVFLMAVRHSWSARL
jgi:MFS transporter, AAHS family, 4-hydroxybenzoate transporter